MDEHLLRFDKDKVSVFIDCETENLCLNRSHNVPWQVAMIKTKNGEKIDEKDFLISWERDLHVGAMAARITRFSTTKHKNESIPHEQVFPTIKDWLDDADYILGHNVLGFDIYLIKGMYEQVGEDYTHLMNKILDTMCLIRGVKLDLKYKPETESLLEYQYKVLHTRRKGVKTNLQAVAKEYKIEHDYENLHNALVDLELNLKVWNKLKWQIEI